MSLSLQESAFLCTYSPEYLGGNGIWSKSSHVSWFLNFLCLYLLPLKQLCLLGPLRFPHSNL